MLTKAQTARLKAYGKTPKEDRTSFFAKNVAQSGMYWFMPLLGWVEPRDPPYVVLSGTLLRIADQSYAGTASWRIPLTPANHEPLLALLSALGWDGALWPIDGGWPAEAPEEEGMLTLLKKVPLGNTLSFVPDPVKGTRVLRVLLAKANGDMPMPLDVDPADQLPPTDRARARFAELVKNPDVFMPVGWSGSKRSLEGVDFPVAMASP